LKAKKNATAAAAALASNHTANSTKVVNKTVKYTDSEEYKEQKHMLNQIETIYLNRDNDAAKKVMLFTS